MEKVTRVYSSEKPFKVSYIRILVSFDTSTHLEAFSDLQIHCGGFREELIFFQCRYIDVSLDTHGN